MSKVNKAISLVLLILAIFGLGSGVAFAPAWFQTNQLTQNAFDDYDPQVSGNNIAWQGYDGADFEIFLFNGSTVTTLTANAFDDGKPQVSGNNIVWEGYDGNDSEIFL